MNPYLEQSYTWNEFHTDFLLRARDALAPQVGTHFVVKVEVAPVQLRLPVTEVQRQRHLEIHDRRNRRVVTVLELLSPSNKTPGDDREAYLAKRRQLLAGQTHFIEIDLRRGGRRPALPELPLSDYYALVSRHQDRPKVDFWPIGLRDPLPSLPIPLEPPDSDVLLDLKAVVDRAYDAGDYGKYIYQEMPEPPLAAADAEWAGRYLPHPV
jgi:hypothetical protein